MVLLFGSPVPYKEAGIDAGPSRSVADGQLTMSDAAWEQAKNRAAVGEVPLVSSALEQVQIDHTIIDVVIADERERQSTGRPYLSGAIDVFGRALVGMV